MHQRSLQTMKAMSATHHALDTLLILMQAQNRGSI